jgi:hypothetical protein
MSKQKIEIASLVPSERFLNRTSIDEAKLLISAGESKPPRVCAIRGFYYVRDGNHRVMAAKELGKDFIECTVEEHKSRPNVSDFEEDDCSEAVSAGLAGFKLLKIGSVQEKEQAYADEEDDIL